MDQSDLPMGIPSSSSLSSRRSWSTAQGYSSSSSSFSSSSSSSSSSQGSYGRFLQPRQLRNRALRTNPAGFPFKTSGVAGRGRSASSATPHRDEDSLLQKLQNRELFGNLKRSRRFKVPPNAKLFTRLPGRLAFCLKDAVPMSAIEAGHVFLGFSKCGQFLLSYTTTTADVDLVGFGIYHYHYRLHWWLFLPYKRAKKVSEVLLFSNEGALANLHISFCQWPNDATKLVVYGYGYSTTTFDDSVSDSGGCNNLSSRPCYLTVTAVPSLDGCKDCVKVAATYEEEDVAEAWNSCVRLSCLEHGLTVHTTFDLVPPYPKFEPKVSLKRSNFVVINTGNLLHSLQVTMEKLNKDSRIEDSTNYPPIDLFPSFLPKTAAESGVTAFSAVSPSEYQQQPRQWSELNVATGSEINFCGGEVFSPPPPASTSSGLWSPGSSLATAPTLPYSAASDSETTDCESDYGGGGAYDGKNGSKSKKNYYIQNAERLEAVSEFVEQLNSGNNSSHHGIVTRRKRSLLQCFQSEFGPSSSAAEDASTPGPSTSAYSSSNSSSSRKRMIAAEKAYDMTEDDFDVDGVREKLSTFRKKRLAEKTYEFKEEEDDAENITPLPRLRTQRSEERTLPVEVAAAAAKSPRSVQELEGGAECILKPLSENCANLSSSPPSEDAICLTDVTGLMVEVPELLSPGGMVKKDQQQSSSNVIHSPRPAADQQQPPRFHAKFTRRFIELDDEMISVITDIEDDELGGQATMTGYHTVLPLEVHGSGYQAMAMISKSKAEKLNRRCVKAQQRTLDLEVFCHYMAQKLCQAAGKKYWFCNDYDVEIIDLDPESGNIICVAVVLVKATIVTKRVSQQQQQKYSISSLHRHQYQGSFKFSWNMDTAQCTVIDSEPLKEIVGAFNDHSPSDGTTGVWHPAKSISQSIQRSWGVTSGHQAAAVKCFTNDAVIRGTSLTTIIDSEHLVAIFQDNLD